MHSSKEPDTPTWTIVLGGVVASTILILALTAAGGWAWVSSFLSGAAANWVQAIGSIVAIVAAWTIANRQHRREDERREREAAAHFANMRQTVWIATFDTWQTLDYIATSLARRIDQYTSIGTERVEDLQATFRALALKELPAELYPDVLRVQRELSYTLLAIRQLPDVRVSGLKVLARAQARKHPSRSSRPNRARTRHESRVGQLGPASPGSAGFERTR
jgi:hypothetical protein